MKIWMKFNVMRWTSLSLDAVQRHAQDDEIELQWLAVMFAINYWYLMK